jgi:hypothetical protein
MTKILKIQHLAHHLNGGLKISKSPSLNPTTPSELYNNTRSMPKFFYGFWFGCE